MPKRIQLPDDFYKHDFKHLAKIEKRPRSRIRFIGLSHIQNGKNRMGGSFGAGFLSGSLGSYLGSSRRERVCVFHIARYHI
jgi:hypothetical protein